MSAPTPGEVRVSDDGTTIAWYRPENASDPRPWITLAVDPDREDEVADWRVVGTTVRQMPVPMWRDSPCPQCGCDACNCDEPEVSVATDSATPDRDAVIEFLRDLYLAKLDVDHAPQEWPRLTADALIKRGWISTNIDKAAAVADEAAIERAAAASWAAYWNSAEAPWVEQSTSRRETWKVAIRAALGALTEGGER